MDPKQFSNPPKAYREIPFWSLNDDLQPEELVRQIRLMDEAGWGGFFMHSRVGLKTPYMGERWMECIRACVDEARKRGMGAWVYDEDKWPSGYAGGLSVAANPDFRSHFLVCKVDNRLALLAERIATYVAREVNGTLVDFRAEAAPTHLENDERLVQFYPMTMPLTQEWFNDYAYLDLMNPDAVKAFLDSTHQVYADTFAEDMGKTIPGIFTDEPCYVFRIWAVRQSYIFVPWTIGFEEYFKSKNGYDLLPHLPALFFPGIENSAAYRYDFYHTALHRFVESYTMQVSEFCEKHHVAYTGHYMAEDTLLEQIDWTGASMPQYVHMHIPGIDKLNRHVNGYCGMLLTVKQLDSVVCQTGKPRALCENYGAAGADTAHTGRKWIGDWAYVLGITLNNPHLSLYSLRGERKRDFPQNLFYQQPWWPENDKIASYFARLSYLLSQGQRVVDTVVIHPIGSAWTVYQPGANKAIDELDERFNQLLMTLAEHQRDFHLADEDLIAPGGATEGKVIRSSDGPRLQVGKMSYRLVIIPSGTTLAATTVALLKEFAQAGGKIISVPPAPTLINARPTSEAILPAATLSQDLAGLPALIDSLLPFDVQIQGQPNVWIHHRHIDGQEVYFMANIDADHGTTAQINLRGTGRLESWDPATGAIAPLAATNQEGVTSLVRDFAPAGSHLLVLHPNETPTASLAAGAQVKSTYRLSSDWSLALENENSLTLDSVAVKIDNGTWSQPAYVMDAFKSVLSKGVETPFSLRYTFNVSEALPKPIYLAVETPERFKITLNGQVISQKDWGWWVDISFRKLNLEDAIQLGNNELILEGIFKRDTELESVYIVGDFGVKTHRIGFENRFAGQLFDRYAPCFSLVKRPECISAAQRLDGIALDLTDAGAPFYAGRAKLSQTVVLPHAEAHANLEFTTLRAAVAVVWVNGKRIGDCAWEPHQVDLGDALQAGANLIEIELVPTTRNLLGPHHRAGGDTEGTGPGDFNDKTRWTEDIILVPLGFDDVTLKVFGE